MPVASTLSLLQPSQGKPARGYHCFNRCSRLGSVRQIQYRLNPAAFKSIPTVFYCSSLFLRARCWGWSQPRPVCLRHVCLIHLCCGRKEARALRRRENMHPHVLGGRGGNRADGATGLVAVGQCCTSWSGIHTAILIFTVFPIKYGARYC